MGLNHEERQIEELLKLYHGVDTSTPGGHRKYRFPDGRTFVMSATSSDRRSAKNALRDLKKFLNIEKPVKDAGERKPSTWVRNNDKHRELNISIQAGEARRSLAEQLSQIYKGENHGT